jgi:hypothetical protein
VTPSPYNAVGLRQREQKIRGIIDEFCEDDGIIPTDPDQMRQWLRALVGRAYQRGRDSVIRESSRR